MGRSLKNCGTIHIHESHHGKTLEELYGCFMNMAPGVAVP